MAIAVPAQSRGPHRREIRIDAEVKKIAPQMKMPGFRPGKVPANLVKKMHRDQLLQEAPLDPEIQDGVQKAITDNKLRPATQPHVHLDEGYAPGKNVRPSRTPGRRRSGSHAPRRTGARGRAPPPAAPPRGSRCSRSSA